MFELVFGVVWLIFSVAFSIPFYMVPDNQEIYFLVFIFGIFYLVGIVLIYTGAKKIIKNKKTDKLGAETYGKIINIENSGTYVNGRPELKADIITYVPDENIAKTFSETIGFAPPRYNIGDYLKLKVFNDDVNVISSINENEVPLREKEMIDDTYSTQDNPNEIIVNGIRYIRADCITKDLNNSFDYNNNNNW